MPQQLTKLSDKDFKLLKKEGTGFLGENGPFFPTFGNHIDDFVKFYVYDLNDTYLKYGISEDFQNTDDGIKLNPGNDLRKVGFTRGNYKVKYFFYRRLAGADEVVLTKTVGDESGIVHSGNPQLTGVPMGDFYVEESGKVFQGNGPPADGSPPSELDVKEYKFFVDEISADRTEVRLAPQSINLDRYKEEFDDLSNEYGIYTPINEFDNPTGVFNQINETGFNLNPKAVNDQGFKNKFIGGTLEVENAFVIGYTEHTNTNGNDDWSLEDPIPTITIETHGYSVNDNNATTDTAVIFTARRENGDVAPSNLSYYWDFGCGHKEFGTVNPYPDSPTPAIISHTYTITGNMNVSVVINSPNFVSTIILDNPLSITYPPDDPDSPTAPTPTSSSPLDGKIIYWDGNSGTQGTPQKYSGVAVTTNTRFYVQSGHRRWITTGYNLGLLRELRGLDSDSDIDLYTNLMNTLPIGPQIGGTQLTGAPTGLDESITDGYLLGSLDDSGDDSGGDDSGDDSGGDDSGDDSGGDDSGTQQTFYTLSVDVKYNSATGNGYTPVDLPHTISNEPQDHVINAYIKIDGVNVGGSYFESYLEGESVDIEIVDDSYPLNLYGFVGWAGSGTSYDGTRTQEMSGDVNLTAIIRIPI